MWLELPKRMKFCIIRDQLFKKMKTFYLSTQNKTNVSSKNFSEIFRFQVFNLWRISPMFASLLESGIIPGSLFPPGFLVLHRLLFQDMGAAPPANFTKIYICKKKLFLWSDIIVPPPPILEELLWEKNKKNVTFPCS